MSDITRVFNTCVDQYVADGYSLFTCGLGLWSVEGTNLDDTYKLAMDSFLIEYKKGTYNKVLKEK